ncbi:hypothetical protein THRCLA_20470 [Thraustotheca clavata]|uniref:Uncharacterized protein n=1 Tax=Thraustotheca clavata TaxID=74557 RepID=A0A1W0A743_9STRA|nr:hypothetical protein THRCLA_20470 [Thraustotheca clavata]
MDVLRSELHNCVSQLASAAKNDELENIEIFTAQRLEIKNKMSLIQDQLVALGAPSVGNRSSITARRSTITLYDPTAPLNLVTEAQENENILAKEEVNSTLEKSTSTESDDNGEITLEAVMNVEPNEETKQATEEVATDTPRDAECHNVDEDIKLRPTSIVVLDEAVPYCRLTDDMDEDYQKEFMAMETLDEHKAEGEKGGEVMLSDRCIRLYTISNHRLDLSDNTFDFKAVKTFAL